MVSLWASKALGKEKTGTARHMKRLHSRMRITIAAIALLFVAVIGITPVMADDCLRSQVILENVYIPSGSTVNVPDTFRGTTRDCADCSWNWTITRVDGALPIERYHFPNSLQYTFTRSGLYDVLVQVEDRRSHCAGYRSNDAYRQTISVARNNEGNQLGGGGNCWQPRVTLSPAGTEGLINTWYTWVARSENSCIDCTYSFRIVKTMDAYGSSVNEEIPLGRNDINPSTPWELSHAFTEQGFYQIFVTVSNPPTCVTDNYSNPGQASSAALIQLPEAQRGVGFGGICQDPHTVNLDVWQSMETSEIGGRIPAWAPSMSPGCTDCSYTWSIYKITPDTWVPYPSASENTYVQGMGTFYKAFTEPGDYKINLIVKNPPACQNAADRYVSMTAVHHVLPATRTDSPGDVPAPVQTPYTVGIDSPPGVVIPDGNVVEPGVVVIGPSDAYPFESFIKASAGGLLKKNTSVVAAVVVTNKSQNAPAQPTKKAAPVFVPGLVAAAGLIAIALYRRQ